MWYWFGAGSKSRGVQKCCKKEVFSQFLEMLALEILIFAELEVFLLGFLRFRAQNVIFLFVFADSLAPQRMHFRFRRTLRVSAQFWLQKYMFSKTASCFSWLSACKFIVFRSGQLFSTTVSCFSSLSACKFMENAFWNIVFDDSLVFQLSFGLEPY